MDTVIPMWFRGLEVTLLGFLFSFFYLKYGLLTVIVAHYLFDAFWTNSAYLLGQTTPFLFYSSIAVLALPLIFGIIAFIINRSDEERAMIWKLNKHQVYNIEILKTFLNDKNMLKNKNEEDLHKLKKGIISNGWDIAVVEMAFDDILKQT